MKTSIAMLLLASVCLIGYADTNSESWTKYCMKDQGYEKLFLAPGVNRLRVESDLTRTIYVPAKYAEKILAGEATILAPDAQVHFGESWLQQQLETRTQTYRQILSVDDGVWSQEVIAEAGPLYPDYHHLLDIVDLNSKEWTFIPLSHPKPDNTLRIRLIPISDEAYFNLRRLALTDLTFGELLGRREALPMFLEWTGATEEHEHNGFTRVTRYVNPEDDLLVAEIEEDFHGRLLRAAYWESINRTVRDLSYGEYVTEPETGIEYPREVTMKRYVHAGLEKRTPETLAEEITIRVTSIEAQH